MLSISTLLFAGGLVSYVNGDVTIHHCSFDEMENLGNPNWFHIFTADECTNGLPSGNCMVGYKRTRAICNSRYAVLPGEVRSVGPPTNRVDIAGPASVGFFSCDFGFDGQNTPNILYEMDFICVNNENNPNDTSWRTSCERFERPANQVAEQLNVTGDGTNLYTIEALLRDEDCDNGLPVNSNGNTPSFGECVSFNYYRLFPGADYSQITLNSDDPRFPGVEFYDLRSAPIPLTRTTVGYICDVKGLEDYCTSSDSGSDSSSNSGSSSSSDDASCDREFRSYTCSVPNSNAVEVLDGFTNGNEFNNGAIEYVYYKFKNNDCTRDDGENKKPPSVKNGKNDCVVSFRSERDCGLNNIGVADLNTREALNRGETDDLTGKKGPGVIYSRPTGIDCSQEETIIEVDYLCAE